jgi:hypothetical protein
MRVFSFAASTTARVEHGVSFVDWFSCTCCTVAALRSRILEILEECQKRIRRGTKEARRKPNGAVQP